MIIHILVVAVLSLSRKYLGCCKDFKIGGRVAHGTFMDRKVDQNDAWIVIRIKGATLGFVQFGGCLFAKKYSKKRSPLWGDIQVGFPAPHVAIEIDANQEFMYARAMKNDLQKNQESSGKG